MAARLLAVCAFLGVWAAHQRYLVPAASVFLLLACWVAAALRRPPTPRVRAGGWCPRCRSLAFHAPGCPASTRRGGGRR